MSRGERSIRRLIGGRAPKRNSGAGSISKRFLGSGQLGQQGRLGAACMGKRQAAGGVSREAVAGHAPHHAMHAA